VYFLGLQCNREQGERVVSDMTCHTSSETLNSVHSLAHYLYVFERRSVGRVLFYTTLRRHGQPSCVSYGEFTTKDHVNNAVARLRQLPLPSLSADAAQNVTSQRTWGRRSPAPSCHSYIITHYAIAKWQRSKFTTISWKKQATLMFPTYV